MWTSSVGGSVGGNRGRRQLIRPVFLGATRGLFSLILPSLFPSSFTYVLLQHFRLLTGARGKVVMRVAVADRVGNDRSDGGSCEKLLGVRRELRCSCAAFEAVEPCRSGAGLAWLL
ncbi:hypothetical protein Taro_002724 [Colocasia esculenta]|uniref:Uncharacterized protein n=1 Tax=Colocasia esculenta TaxID=4460 RepID=A0A843TJL6_COLES|nr:hypothetical protein [Colocasia esculenta]